MPARRSTRTLIGLAAGVTVTAMLGATLGVPASAAPIERDRGHLSSRKLDGKVKALPDKWFVQVSGKAALRGGTRTAATTSQSSVKEAATNAGVKYSVLHSYTRVWNGFSVKASATDANRLRALPGVTAIYPVYPVALPESASAPQLKYSLPMIGANVAQVSGFKGDGIKVGVIDTGIDYNHPDLGGSGIEGNDADFGPASPRVKYGKDFVGDDYNAEISPSVDPDAFPDDCNGHGTHVAGIIGADGKNAPGHATGVAPNVTFGAYRVFGCDGSADTEVILAAMDQAAADDMDVVNMSLGSTFDSWPDYPEAAAASALTAAGTIVVVSAGNSAYEGLFAAGNLAVGKDVISVASVENTAATNWVFHVAPATNTPSNIPFVPADGAPVPPASGDRQLVRASVQDGCEPLADLTGKIALIQPGTCNFSVKAANAEDAGAVGVVLYNNETGIFNATVAGAGIGIPVVVISQEHGEGLWDQLGNTGTLLSWTAAPQEDTNPLAGTVSDFSSFGMSATLTATPDVAAPGGNIWSTVPLEKSSYANYSGTSMAAPHVTGSVALLLQAKPSLKGNVNEVRATLQNTATPVDELNYFGDILSYYEPAIRQGAGLIHIDKAIAAATAATTVTPGKISLGENRTSYYKTTLKLTNRGTKAETYKLSLQNAVNAVPLGSNYMYDYDTRKVSVTFSSSSVTVKAGKTATVAVSIRQPSGLKLGSIYSGWVKLTKSDKSKTLVVPFAGFQGDYQKVKVLQDVIGYDGLADEFYPLVDLPALATYDGDDPVTGEPQFTLLTDEPKHTFSLVDAQNSPTVLFHLEYAVNNAYFNIYKASATGGKGAEVFPGYKTFGETGKVGRDSYFQYASFDGKIPFSGSTASGLTVPDGDYVIEIKVLKALGSASNSAHWETYTTPAFTINRSDG